MSPPRPDRATPASLVAAGVVLLGVLLRLRGFVAFPLEQDELYTVIEATELFATRLAPGIDGRPLYFLLEHLLLGLAPPSPVTLRLPPLIFGITGLWVTWRLGERIAGPTAGVIAVAFAAISPWHLYASAFARYWSLVYLLTALALLLALRAYDAERPRDYVLALSAGVLGSFTHPSFLFAVAGAVLGLHLVHHDGHVGWRWPTKRAWVLLWGPWATAVGVGLAAFQLFGREGALQNFGGRGPAATLRLVPAMIQWMTPSMFAAGGLGAVACVLLPGRPEVRRWGAVAVMGCASALGLLSIAALRTDVYADYGIGLLPLVFVSAGALVALAAERLPRPWLAAAAATAILAAGVLPSTVSHLSDGTRFDYRPALERIAREDPTAPVLAWPEAIARHYAPDLVIAALRPPSAYLDSVVQSSGRAWLLLSLREYGVAGVDASVEEWAYAHCRRTAVHERLRFDSRRYRVELYRCEAPGFKPFTSAGHTISSHGCGGSSSGLMCL